jgi:hypothetical protein
MALTLPFGWAHGSVGLGVTLAKAADALQTNTTAVDRTASGSRVRMRFPLKWTKRGHQARRSAAPRAGPGKTNSDGLSRSRIREYSSIRLKMTRSLSANPHELSTLHIICADDDLFAASVVDDV